MKVSHCFHYWLKWNVATQKEDWSWKLKMQQISCRILRGTWKGLSSKRRWRHAERDVLSGWRCRMLNILQTPCKQRISSWLPLWVYECAIWAFHCSIMALSFLNSIVCFSLFLTLVVLPVFSFLGVASLFEFLDFTCPFVHLNQSHNRKEITNTAYGQTMTPT